MCGRAALTASGEDLRQVFGLDAAPEVTPHYNIPPSQPLHVVRVARATGGRRLDALRWGLVPLWAKDETIGHRLTLARVETVLSTPAFRDAIRRRRCLVAVDGFFEWRREGTRQLPGTGPERKKARPGVPFFVHRGDHAVFALAGVWERWVSRDGEVIESCAILTQPAQRPLDAIHDRMPIVVDPADWDAWLDRDLTDGVALERLLRARAPDLVAYPVTSYVNDPRHDDGNCLSPAPGERPPG